ncbi:MAG: zinc ABC transporter substrate-binding protein [Thiotrichales bacterium]|nr:zinc ABC transporter substrate-binding protein [Thiotrichales bacterium]
MRQSACNRGAVLALLVMALCETPAYATEKLRVVVTLLPLHSLVAGVSEGGDMPGLLIPAGGDPHQAQLRPSQRRLLDQAELIYWVGPALETRMVGLLGRGEFSAKSVALIDTDGLVLHPTRTLVDWYQGQHEHSHDHHEHDTVQFVDAHFWLDPNNAIVIVNAVAEQLSLIDPEHRSRYEANALQLRERLLVLDAELEVMLTALRDERYVVFHDAYQYFEKRYGLRPVGAVSTASGHRPGAQHLKSLREVIARSGVRCAFSEPQFADAHIKSIAADTGLQIGSLDATGRNVKPGAGAYFDLMRNNARALLDCLQGSRE